MEGRKNERSRADDERKFNITCDLFRACLNYLPDESHETQNRRFATCAADAECVPIII